MCRAESAPAASRATNDAVDCARARKEAFELSNEGDRVVKIDVSAAIPKCVRATELFPVEHRIYWKLAAAYEKRSDWLHMAEALTHATALAPTFANYWFRLGLAWVNQAEEGDRGAYQRAKAPLERCIALDANIAECHYFLGEVSLWTGDPHTALIEYSEAIKRNARTGYFYPPLAELYRSLGLESQAEAVLTEAMQKVESNEQNRNALRTTYMLLAVLAQRRKAKPAQLAAMEHAAEYADENHPEMAFMLGSTYAVLDPPDMARATRFLKYFTKNACSKPVSAAKFKEQCEQARSLLLHFGDK